MPKKKYVSVNTWAKEMGTSARAVYSKAGPDGLAQVCAYWMITHCDENRVFHGSPQTAAFQVYGPYDGEFPPRAGRSVRARLVANGLQQHSLPTEPIKWFIPLNVSLTTIMAGWEYQNAEAQQRHEKLDLPEAPIIVGWLCQTCQARFSEEGAYNAHMTTHSSSQRACRECSAVLPDQAELLKHYAKEHHVGPGKSEKQAVVLALLRSDAPTTREEIASVTGFDTKLISSYLKALKRRGLVRFEYEHRYQGHTLWYAVEKPTRSPHRRRKQPPNSDYVKTKDATIILGLSSSSFISRLVREGKLDGYGSGRGWLVSRGDVERIRKIINPTGAHIAHPNNLLDSLPVLYEPKSNLRIRKGSKGVTTIQVPVAQAQATTPQSPAGEGLAVIQIAVVTQSGIKLVDAPVGEYMGRPLYDATT